MRGLHQIIAVVLCLVFSQAEAQSSHPAIPGQPGMPILRAEAIPEGTFILHSDPVRAVPRLLAGTGPAPGAESSIEDAAWAHLSRHASLYRLEDALPFVQVKAVHRQEQGPLIVAFQAEVHGLPVFRDELKVAMARDRSLLGISGFLSPYLAAAATRQPSFLLDMEEAIALALHRLNGGSPLTPALASLGTDDAGLHRYRIPGLELSIRAGKVLFDDSQSLIAAYYVELIDESQAFSQVVDARMGDILFENDLLWHARYRVWANHDGVPHPNPMGRSGTPFVGGATTAFVESTLVEREHGPISTLDPWLAPLAEEAKGNNVAVFADNYSKLRAPTTEPGVFDYSVNFGLRPNSSETQIRAGLIQAFYASNWIHDILYDAGFDEGWRNAQANNYGRGGAGGDNLIAQTQSAQALENAFIVITSDGYTPVMKLGISKSNTSSARDIALDSSVVAHEYGHLLTTRLIGNGNGLSSLQARSMGEGWSDFLSLILMVSEEDASLPDNGRFQGSYPLGAFYSRSSNFGVRRYPYSTSLDVNPLTFAHVSNAAQLPDDVPRSPQEMPNASIHAAGEVWASMLWEIYASFLNDRSLGFDRARQRMLHLLVASLKLTPSQPTYIEARDAIFLAAGGFDEADRAKVHAAFAKRGAGIGADGPDPRTLGAGPAVESFHGAPGLHLQAIEVIESSNNCDNDGIVDAGEVGYLRVRIGNGDLSLREGAIAHVSSNSPGVRFSSPGRLIFAPLAPLQVSHMDLPFTIDDTGQLVPVEFVVALEAPGRWEQRAAVRVLANYDRDIHRAETFSPSFACLDPAWTADGTSSSTCTQESGARWSCQFSMRGGELSLTSPRQPKGMTGFSFIHSFNIPEGTDTFAAGGVIEASHDGRSWFDVGEHASPPYNGVVRANVDSPLAGRPAFVGSSQGSTVVTLRLPTSYLKEELRVRFRASAPAMTGLSSGPVWQISALRFHHSGADQPATCLRLRDQRQCNDGRVLAEATVPLDVIGGTRVRIDASNSFDPRGQDLSYDWTGHYRHPTYQSPVPLKFVDRSSPATEWIVPQVQIDTVGVVVLHVSSQESGSVRREFNLTIHAFPITAKASSDMDFIPSGGQGLLSGSGDDPGGKELRFNWEQLEGPSAVIDRPHKASTTFTAPAVDEDTRLRFALTVSKGNLSSQPAEVVVTVLKPAAEVNQPPLLLEKPGNALEPVPAKTERRSGCASTASIPSVGICLVVGFYLATSPRKRPQGGSKPLHESPILPR